MVLRYYIRNEKLAAITEFILSFIIACLIIIFIGTSIIETRVLERIFSFTSIIFSISLTLLTILPILKEKTSYFQIFESYIIPLWKEILKVSILLLTILIIIEVFGSINSFLPPLLVMIFTLFSYLLFTFWDLVVVVFNLTKLVGK